MNINLEQAAGWSVDVSKEDFDFNQLAWSHIDFGIKPEFFIEERLKAQNEITTQDCSFGKCTNCGVCQKFGVGMDIAGER